MLLDEMIPVITEKYQAIKPLMNERLRRLWAASEARALGWGGIQAVSAATGLSRATIRTGLRELKHPEAERWESASRPHRVRRGGGGRHRLVA